MHKNLNKSVPINKLHRLYYTYFYYTPAILLFSRVS